jgi:uncharacterized phiE125 gp8 family phage protein
MYNFGRYLKYSYELITDATTLPVSLTEIVNFLKLDQVEKTVSSLTQTGGTATATVTNHGYITGEYVIIKGATPDGYNGDHQITVVDANTFTYSVSAALASPATGTIKSSLIYESDVLLNLISSAVKYAETYTKRDFITKTYKTFRNTFYDQSGSLILLKSPVQSIEFIKYLVDDTLTTLDASFYKLRYSTEYQEIVPVEFGTTFPTNLDETDDAVQIQFKVGYGDNSTDVPPDILEAIKLIVSFYYWNRNDCIMRSEEMISKKSRTLTPAMVLLDTYRIIDIASF